MVAKSIWLIKTKLLRPALSVDALERPRLLDRLHQPGERVLTLICAPAGMGKTTLLLQWLGNARMPVAWYSMEGGASDLYTVLAYLVASVQNVFPRSCSGMQSISEAALTPTIDHVAAQLINDLAELPGDLILVLDDYHAMHDMDVHEVMGRLVDHMPPNVRLVITSRTQPPLPVSGLRARGQMAEVRAADLRFEANEMRAFAARASGRSLPESVTAALLEHTEGWGVGVRMAVVSLAAARSEQEVTDLVANLRQTPQHMLDYLTDQVLARQSQELLHFLLCTALLERFNTRLCAALLFPAMASTPPNAVARRADEEVGLKRAAQLLRTVEQANLFVVPLDAQGEWFRYHGLFRELLLSRLPAHAGAMEISAMHNRAAQWFYEHGYVEEAIDHALVDGDLETAAALVESVLPDLLNRMDRPLLETLVGRLPAELLENRPILLLARAWTYQLAARDYSIPPLVERAQLLFENVPLAQQDLVRGQLAALVGMLNWQTMQAISAIEYSRQALALLPVQHAYVRGIAHVYLCAGLQAIGQRQEVDSYVDSELAKCGPLLNAYSARLLMTKFLLPFMAGGWNQVEQWSRVLLERSRRDAYSLTVSWGHYGSAIAAFERWQTQVALQHLTSVVELTYSSHLRAVVDSHLALAILYGALKQYDRVEAHLEAAGEIVIANSLFPILEEIRSCRARVALNSGDVALAMRHLNALSALDAPTTMLFKFEVPHLTAARVLLAAGGSNNRARARSLLNILSTYMRRNHHTRWEADLQFVRAQLLLSEGREDDAQAAVVQALRICEVEDALRPLVELGEPLLPVLRHLLGRGVACDLIERALVAMPGAGAASDNGAAVGGLVEPLTNREMDVLELLVDRLTNKEIAQALGVGTATIQTHLNNLYQKLNAENRRDAVVKAREFGILG